MSNTFYVDVHAHLTHPKFASDLDEVVHAAGSAGLGAIVVNGLEPVSNRQTLAMAERFPLVKPALGIYPVYGAMQEVAHSLSFDIAPFDVTAEIAFIEQMAMAKKIAAIGECGLDDYWLPAESHAAQEATFASLIDIAQRADLPIIVHSRKMEVRAMEMLASAGAQRVVFHCYCGRTKHALRGAEQHGWHFSIPANAHKNEAFQKLLRELPPEALLTETDSPYLAPVAQTRNEPKNVLATIDVLARLRSWTQEQAKAVVWHNYQRVFSHTPSSV